MSNNLDGEESESSQKTTEQKKAGPTVAERLVSLADDLGIKLFRDRSGGAAYAKIPNGSAREFRPVAEVGDLLAHELFRRERKAASGSALADAVRILGARARYGEGVEECEVFLRVGGDGTSCIDIDLGTDAWSMAHVTPQGWTIVKHGDRCFRRSSSMAPLPLPKRGGTLASLRKFVRVVDDGDFALYCGHILSSLRPKGPYVILKVGGEHGSTKSTAVEVERKFIDPSLIDLRSLPRTDRDLAVAADGSWLLAFDNLSSLPDWLSDCLCRLSTGGGFAIRKGYTDRQEEIFNDVRPVAIAGIGDVGTRPDFLDRTVVVRLQPIDKDRKTPEDFWSEFESERPFIFGAILDALSLALREYPNVKRDMTEKPRMASFACWAAAAEPAFGCEPGTFAKAYRLSQGDAVMVAIQDSSLAGPLESFLGASKEKCWGPGTASGLLAALNAHPFPYDDDPRRKKGWPVNASRLGSEIRRLAPFLRQTDPPINFKEGTAHEKKRTIHLELGAEGTEAVEAEAPLAPSSTQTLEGKGAEGTEAAEAAESTSKVYARNVREADFGPNGWSQRGRVCQVCRRIGIVRMAGGQETCRDCLNGAA